MTVDEVMAVVEEADFNVTFSGGDPLYQAEAIVPLAERIKASGKTIWCYTGFRYERIKDDPKIRPLLDLCDVLVDGPFLEELRDISLDFRGSSNQRIIRLH